MIIIHQGRILWFISFRHGTKRICENKNFHIFLNFLVVFAKTNKNGYCLGFVFVTAVGFLIVFKNDKKLSFLKRTTRFRKISLIIFLTKGRR